MDKQQAKNFFDGTTKGKLTMDNGPEYTEASYKDAFGFIPEQDDLARVNCKVVSAFGHQQCGVCLIHKLPRFICGCVVKASWGNRPEMVTSAPTSTCPTANFRALIASWRKQADDLEKIAMREEYRTTGIADYHAQPTRMKQIMLRKLAGQLEDACKCEEERIVE